MERTTLLLLLSLTAYVGRASGCTVAGVSNWWLDLSVVDTDRGVVFQGATTDISGIQLAEHSGDGLNSGPYLVATHADSTFTLALSDDFGRYEENETSMSMSFSVTFTCSTGSSLPIVFIISVIDTNNNDPIFTAGDEITFTITPPLPPGYLVTGCAGGINVRDIDLTTQSIEFAIENNDYFEIAYDAGSSTEAKNFAAVLRTTTLIRSLSEPVSLWISATDVDQTGDPPRTTFATLRIEADGDFELPEEPTFSQVYYMATYSTGHELSLDQPVYLTQGYDDDVSFNLTGEYASYFQHVRQGNQVTIDVTSPLPTDVITQGYLLLVLSASREYTSGASATIVVRLPEVPGLEFEETHYEGTIADDTLFLSQITLSQGYENGYEVTISSQYASFFEASQQSNIITITKQPLDTNIIEENTFLTLQLTATSNTSSATAVILLEIIKNDTVTPMFEERIYEGSYTAETGLDISTITLYQGYDDTVSFYIQGDYENYFTLSENMNVLTLQLASALPQQILEEQQQILLTIGALKPRTVGAHTAVSISLPTVPGLEFEETHYEGTIADDTLFLSQITLSQGYENGYEVTISSQYASFFEASQQSNIITITKQPLDTNIIEENTFLTLQLTATSNTSSATAVILLEIIKNDTVTPMFEERIYEGSYTAETGLDISTITLYQGYDDTVSFYIQGDYENYFTFSENMNVLTLQLVSALPQQILEEQQQILLTIGALKPRTVGAHTAVSISLPTARELRFEEISYIGTVVENTLTLESIFLSTGYSSDVNFTLQGDHASFFTATNLENAVTIDLSTPLTEAIIEGNNFLVLGLEATGTNALKATASVLLEIIKQDTITPVFERHIYYGTYEETNTVTIDNISLIQGYDNSVTFRLEGDHSQYFTVSNSGNSVVLSLEADIPEEIIYNSKVLIFNIIANKPQTVGANAAVSITFPQALTEAAIMRFTQHNYVGSFENETLTLENILLETGYTATTVFTLTGEFASYFAISNNGNAVSVSASGALPEDLIHSSQFIVLEIEAQRERAVTAHTTIIIDIIQEAITAPVFDEAYYRGVYIGESGLQFERTIYLQQGFDETVTFSLEGEFSEWFSLEQSGEGVTPTSSSEIPQDVLENNRQLLFTVVANKPGAIAARAAVSIDLPDEASGGVLRFAQPSYVGRIESGTLQVEPLSMLGENFDDLNFTITGDYSSYFTLNQEGNAVTIQLAGDLSTEIITSEAVLVLDLQVSKVGWINGFTTIVLEIVRLDHLTPVFDSAFYSGSYSVNDGLTFEYAIQLAQGYDDTVEFTIEGDDGEWFAITQNGNNLTLSIIDEGPSQVTDRSHLVFAVVANKPETLPGRTAIIISLTDKLETEILRFSSPYYSGSIVNGSLLLEDINLAVGYSPDVNFTVTGDLAELFEVTNEGSAVSLQLLSELPAEITENVLILTLEARSLNAVAYTAIVVELTESIDIELIAPLFEEPYYTGSYAEIDGLSFDQQIRLIDGFDASVVFSLEGEQSAWFMLQQSDDVITILLTTSIPKDVLETNRNLVFSVLARRGNLEGRTVVVITLNKDSVSPTVLGFEQNYYIGQLQNDSTNLSTIVLSEGYSGEIIFTLRGDLAEYFQITDVNGTITVELTALIPEDILVINRIILLELEASAPQAISAYTTIVLDNSADDILTPLVFTEPYYTGVYGEQGLVFDSSIALSNGNIGTVTYALEGDYIEWFTLEVAGNVANLSLANAIPEEVLLNNHNLIFTITASQPGYSESRAAIIISLIDAEASTVLRFEEIHYLGSIENNELVLDAITLSEGYTEDVTFTLYGELSSLFNVLSDGPNVRIEILAELPEESIPQNRLIVLGLQASAPQAISTYATVLIEVEAKNEEVISSTLMFNEPYYTGSYTEEDGLIFEAVISLSDGYNENVTFALSGDNTQYFTLTQEDNCVTLSLLSPLPEEVLTNNQRLIFVITAQRPGSNTARSAIVISLTYDPAAISVLIFERAIYQGTIENYTITTLDTIELTQGFSENVDFTLQGELSSLFTLTSVGSNVTLSLEESLPDESVPKNRIILLQLQASGPQAISAYTTIVLEVLTDIDDESPMVTLQFGETYYTGSYFKENSTFIFEDNIILVQGYDDNVDFTLEGENSQWFNLEQNGNSLTLVLFSTIPSDVLENNRKLILTLRAQLADSNIARTVIVISLVTTEDAPSITVLRFNAVSYQGRLESEAVSLDTITLTEGYSDDVQFSIHGELSEYFRPDNDGANVTLALTSSIPNNILQNTPLTVLDIIASADQAVSAYASVILQHARFNETVVIPVFSETYYVGSYSIEDGLSFDTEIVLSEGFDNTVEFELDGENSQWFTIVQVDNSITLHALENLPVSALPYGHFLFAIVARKPGTITARAGIFILLEIDSSSNSEASFGNALYTGTVQSGEISHEIITLSGYNGTEIQILGADADLFEATLDAGSVIVQAANILIFPEDLTYVALELRAGTARTALILDVYHTDEPSVPTVTFSATSYEIRTDVTHTGLVGAVLATADNGERIIYTLQTDNAHLLERLAVNEAGSLLLFAPASSGVYAFSVVASTVATQVSASAPVRLIVDAISTCGDNENLVVPPLIVLDRDEEERHTDLILSNVTGCRFTLTNHWPADQDWLYVDERGLHTRAIDREDPSIAFMAVSQVQVELILECDNDGALTTRSKRSTHTRLDSLGHYDYGNNKWLIADTILYNSRRSFVNLIVNDINDNYPIFVGSEAAPIVVGYPVPELLEVVPPRALVELKATDADVGVNAALLYWSSEPELAVSPYSGSVHVRDNERGLQDGRQLNVHATDRNGEGLTGDITLVVRLLDVEHISVITVRNAFLEEEPTILSNLTQAIGYDVRALTSTVISDEYEDMSSRVKRQAEQSRGASLKLYVYGLRNTVPVDVNELTSDINNNVIASVVIADSVSLQDYLESHEICVIPGRDIGLLAATIVLSVLLFILIVLIALWYFLKWRKARNYEEFSDQSSATSRNDSVNVIPKPDTLTRPRLNIEELKRSERRLQEMLDAPVDDVITEPSSSRTGPPDTTILDVPLPDINVPIVIQSIDKLKAAADEDEEDEYGEIKNNARRKSVVTFNENVEKIIHVEDRPDSDSDPEYEIERL